MNKYFVITLLLISAFFTSCGKTTKVNNSYLESPESSLEDSVIFTPEEEKISDFPTEWSQAYLDYLLNMNTGYNEEQEVGLSYYDYHLIYLDDDDIPELFIGTNVEAGGEFILTYYNGKVTDYHLSRLGTVYVPKSGILYTDTGHMDYYPVYVTKLDSGTFTELAEGEYYLPSENVELLRPDEDEYNKALYTYIWNGLEVSESEFKNHVAEYINLEEARYPDNTYQYIELKSILQTGHHLSYGHHYDLVVEDVNWDDAYEKSKYNNGYLAVITSNEEFDEIKQLIDNQNMSNMAFWVSYRNFEYIGDTYYDDRWVLPDGSYLESHTLYDFSFYFDYDYDLGHDKEEWNFEKFECGLLKYNKRGSELYMYEAPANLLEQYPSYIGNIGYIIEYD